MPVSKRRPEETYEAFPTDEPLYAVALRLGVTEGTLRTWWTLKFGKDAYEARCKKTARGTDASQEELEAAFHTDEPFKAVAARLKVGPNRLRKLWVDKFGQDAFDARCVKSMGATTVSREELEAAFHTDEPFKAVAARVKTSPNTLRRIWVEKFGQEAFDARGKAHHIRAGSQAGKAGAGVTRQISTEGRPCEVCQKSVTLNQFQLARPSRVLCVTCSEVERGVDRHCPVCGLGVVGEKGLTGHLYRPTTGDPVAHAAYIQAQLDAIWEGKEEDRDYIVCLVCQHKGVRIDRHLMSEHRMSVETYRAYHSGAPVQAEVLREVRSASAVAQHQAQPLKGLTKDLACPTCGKVRPVPLTLAPSVHEIRCPECIEAAEEAHWSSLVEGEDYVTCQVCGERADSLVSHVRNAHSELEGKYLETFPGAQMVALGSSIRVKTEETRKKLSEAAHSWRTGLTKETDSRIAATSRATSVTVREARAQKFWRSVELIELSVEQLSKFKLKNGKVSIGKARVALGHCFATIHRECEKHGLEVSRRHVQEATCLEAISKALGGAPYATEWKDDAFINPKTGWHFRFDGYFPDHALLCEFQGYQHQNPDNIYFKNEGDFEAQQYRDSVKASLVEADGRYKLFTVLDSEKYTDPSYLLSRLIDEGIFDPGK
jgi:hypothetical protein